jgi:predicted membrane-bound mannosyltransferase
MIRLAILYASAVGIPALVLIGRSLKADGTHWALFGTLLDQWLQRLEGWAVVLAVLPLLLLACVAAVRGYRRGTLVAGGLAAAIGLVTFALVLLARD